MLDETERRILNEIDEGLEQDYPGLGSEFEELGSRRRWRFGWLDVGAAVSTATALPLLIAQLYVGGVLLLVLGFVLLAVRLR